ncbi:MAG: zonular occludens toxin domain-containing protein [Lentisphaerota bacterium]
MQYIITGGQRNGKTYFCVMKMKSYLQCTERHFYTNLPVHPDIISREIVKVNSVNTINLHNDLKPVVSRIHIMRRFADFSELRDFRIKNPVFCLQHVYRNRSLDYEFDMVEILDGNGNPTGEKSKIYRLNEDGKKILAFNPERLFFPIDCILEYWKYLRYNSIVMIDELYNYFNALASRKSENQDRRIQLQSHLKQHGHDKHDIYLISHDIDDIDPVIRKCCQYIYYCYNSLYTNMIPNEVIKRYPNILSGFRGLKHMYMYFIVEGFEKRNKTDYPDDLWKFRADKRIFACYNSFSRGEGQHKRILDKVSDSASSSDINRSKWLIFRSFISQAWIHFLILGIFITFIYFCYRAVFALIYAGDIRKTEKVSAEVESKTKHQDVLTDVVKVEKVKVKIMGVTPNCIFYNDGYKIQKGGIYEGFEVVDIGRVFCTFVRDGKMYRVATNGVRTEGDPLPK